MVRWHTERVCLCVGGGGAALDGPGRAARQGSRDWQVVGVLLHKYNMLYTYQMTAALFTLHTQHPQGAGRAVRQGRSASWWARC
jgi:hypothetical protein